MNGNGQKKRYYSKPAIVYRDKIDVLAAVCDSNWLPRQPCMVQGNPACLKIKN